MKNGARKPWASIWFGCFVALLLVLFLVLFVRTSRFYLFGDHLRIIAKEHAARMELAVEEGRAIEPFRHPDYGYRIMQAGDGTAVLFTRRGSVWDYPDFVLVVGEHGADRWQVFYGNAYEKSVSSFFFLPTARKLKGHR